MNIIHISFPLEIFVSQKEIFLVGLYSPSNLYYVCTSTDTCCIVHTEKETQEEDEET